MHPFPATFFWAAEISFIMMLRTKVKCGLFAHHLHLPHQVDHTEKTRSFDFELQSGEASRTTTTTDPTREMCVFSLRTLPLPLTAVGRRCIRRCPKTTQHPPATYSVMFNGCNQWSGANRPPFLSRQQKRTKSFQNTASTVSTTVREREAPKWAAKRHRS